MGEGPRLYRDCVPVLLKALGRMEAGLDRAEAQLGSDFPAALDRRPAPGMMPAARQVAMAVQFAVKGGHLLSGGRVAPELRYPLDAPGLLLRIGAARRRLAALDPQDFADAETRIIRVQAGLAHLELPGPDFLHEFVLPNFYFHHAMAHLALKQAGAGLGKADFDGKHEYPEGFSFG